MGLFQTTKAASQPPAIGSLSVQQSCYGTPITIVYGTNRVTGNLLWYGDFVATLITQSSGGGKGGATGGGGKGGGSGTWNYTASFQFGICAGPIASIGEVWMSKQTTNLGELGGSVSLGTLNQEPWGYLTSAHPEVELGYNLVATANFAVFQLGTSAETPQFSFEVGGKLVIGSGNQDADLVAVISDFLPLCGYPADNIGDSSDTATYLKAMGFFISPVIDQQQAANEYLNQWVATHNVDFINSGGQLFLKPYADSPVSGNGVTYTPDLTPIYDLDDDDFIVADGEDAVSVTITDQADAYNQQPIEYVNRADQYNTETYTAQDTGQIDLYGPRVGDTLEAHHVTDPVAAQTMAYLYMWRQIYIENGPVYTFKLPWNYALLDPMDLVTLTTSTENSTFSLTRKLVRIRQIDEDEDGALTFTCEDMPGLIAAPSIYNSQASTRHTPNYNQDPGNINAPIIYEAPLAFVQAASIEIDIAVSAPSALWGGCDVWVSSDGDSYSYLTQINGGARQGVLSADLPTFAPPPNSTIDQANTLAVDLTQSNGVLSGSATQQDAVSLNTICYVDGEIISYGNDGLIDPFKYDLTYLNRGCYGTTISAHAKGSNFARIDQSVIRYTIDQNRVGQTLYFKFVSFNIWGGGQQDVAEVPAFTYKVLGSALLTPLPNPTNLAVSYLDDIAQLNWTAITDIRFPIFYQIRKGAEFISAQIVDTTAQTNFPVYGTDTYWVTALYYTPFGVAVYSPSPPSVSVTTPSIQQNLIESIEEAPTWTGSVSGGAEVSGGDIVLGAGNILDVDNILPIPNVLAYADVAMSGAYTIPVGNIIKSNYVMNAKVIISWALAAVNLAASDIPTIPDITAVSDITGEVASGLVYAIPQIQLSIDGGTTFGDWQNWTPGVYSFNAINRRILLYTLQSNVTPVLSEFGTEVDVPLMQQTGDKTTSASGLVSVTFPLEYNEIIQVVPHITNAVDGDTIITGSITTSGYQVGVINAGSYVVRDIVWTSTGY